jgi:hypothetical protein
MPKYKTTRISPRVSLRKSVVTSPRDVLSIGRNDPCPCGSGEKYKNCCIDKGDHFLKKMAKKQKSGPGIISRLLGRKPQAEKK